MIDTDAPNHIINGANTLVNRFHFIPMMFQNRRAILHMESGISPLNNVYTGELAVEGDELVLDLDDESMDLFGEPSIILVSPEYNNFYKHGIVSLSLQ